MKQLKIGKLSIRVCEHQGDINYLRFVKFKQWAPQFWERMDSPTFKEYFEKFKELHNKGKYAESVMIWYDYQLAIKQTVEQSFDAWGICFALIAIFPKEDEKSCPDDIQLREKIDRLNAEGITAQQVKEGVLNFMKASPEVFAAHLSLYVLPFLQQGIDNL